MDMSNLVYGQFLETLPDAAIVVDRMGKIAMNNSQAETLFGCQPGELHGQPLAGLIPDEKREVHTRHMERFFTQSKTSPQILKLVHLARRCDGLQFPVEITLKQISLMGDCLVLAIVHDISERKRVEEALQESEEKYRLLVETVQNPIFTCDADGRYLFVNTAAAAMFGKTPDQMTGRTAGDFFPAEMATSYNVNLRQVMLTGESMHTEQKSEINGRPYWFDTKLQPIRNRNGQIYAIQAVVHDITESKHSEQALRDNEELLRAAVRVANIGIFDHDHINDTIYWSPRQREIYGVGPDERITLELFSNLLHPDNKERIMASIQQSHDPAGDGVWDVEQQSIYRDGSIRWLAAKSQTYFEGEGSARHAVRTVGAVLDITERKQAEESLQMFQYSIDQASDAVFWISREATFVYVNDEACRSLGYTRAELLNLTLWDIDPLYPKELWAKNWEGYERTHQGGTEHVETFHRRKDGTLVPIEVTAQHIWFGERPLHVAYTHNISERKLAEERIEAQLQRLKALRTIDLALTSSHNLKVTLNVIVKQVTEQLNADAASVLVLNPHTFTLEYAADLGFHERGIEQSRLRLGEGITGRAALEQRSMSVTNFQAEDSSFVRAALMENEELLSYNVTPLIARDKVLGVLEVFHRQAFTPNNDWVDFFEALAAQTAIALDSASLFADLQRTNIELSMAYDATIEGLSRALDLRDEETEGHTQRVAEITVRLAKAMGIHEAEIVHIRRGALLHDIGKMGVPDSILLKPGKLTDDEWVIMRKHPQYAFEMLAPIAHLRPALDIPGCHHEKWDGTGYPRGLKGELIPLAARIFAVVDVWDALCSDRPYRQAWSKDRVREHILAESGKHFDPKIVEIFLTIISE